MEEFVNHICDNIMSRIYKESLQVKNRQKKKQTNLNKNWTKDLNRHFSKEDIQMANKLMIRCSISLIIRKMQIKITKRYHFTHISMTSIKKTQEGHLGGSSVEHPTLDFSSGHDPWVMG